MTFFHAVVAWAHGERGPFGCRADGTSGLRTLPGLRPPFAAPASRCGIGADLCGVSHPVTPDPTRVVSVIAGLPHSAFINRAPPTTPGADEENAMTTTTQLPLNTQAQAMLRSFHRQAGVLPATVEQTIAQQAQTTQAGGTAVALDCDALEKLLLAAMPDQKQAIQQAKGCAATYHCDKTNGRFLTQILSMRIEKETVNAYQPPAPTPPVVRDPLYATFTMAPDADVMLLFNARDVDEKGQPLLMKVVARELSCTAKPLPRDPEEDGVTVSLALDDGFLAAAAGRNASFKDYTMVVGFTDVDGSWKEQSRSVGSDASTKVAFAFECNDFDGLQKKNGNLEARVFTADGVPAQRVLVPFREIYWA